MRTPCRVLAAALAFLALPACSGADLLNSLVPRQGYTVLEDQAYGEGPRHRFDLYLPETAGPATPTIVFFYGGGWDSGSKEDYRFVGQALTSRGYAVAIPDYRLYPEVRFPDFLEDAAAAVARVGADARRDRRPAGPLYLLGHSAGAYIAAMLTLERRWLEQAGIGVCDTVTASVGLAGPYDFLPLQSNKLRNIFGPEETRPRTQPINHVDGRAPPMLLATGRDDTTVLPRNTIRLASRIRDAGGVAEERLYDRIGHIAVVASLARPLQLWSTVLDDVDGFLGRHPGDSPGCVDRG